MLRVVFDAAPLIMACKFEVQGVPVMDHLLPECSIVIAPRVEEEVAILGASYPDGVVAGERVARGGIQVRAVTARKWTRCWQIMRWATARGTLSSYAGKKRVSRRW